MQNKAYTFQLDVKTPVSLKYDQPRQGTGRYGPWYLYGAIINGQETSFFAPEKLNADIQKMGIKKDQLFYITLKTALNEQGKPYKYYEVSTDAVQPVDKFNQSLDQGDVATAKRQEEEKWDKLARGKVRFGISCEYIKLGRKLESETVKEIRQWTEFIMTNILEDEI